MTDGKETSFAFVFVFVFVFVGGGGIVDEISDPQNEASLTLKTILSQSLLTNVK